MKAYEVDALLKKLSGQPLKWLDKVSNKFFTATPEQVHIAELEINEMIHTTDFATVYDWWDLLGIPCEPSRCDGWHIECLFEGGATWLSFAHGLEEDAQNSLYFTVEPELFPCDSFEECHDIRWSVG